VLLYLLQDKVFGTRTRLLSRLGCSKTLASVGALMAAVTLMTPPDWFTTTVLTLVMLRAIGCDSGNVSAPPVGSALLGVSLLMNVLMNNQHLAFRQPRKKLGLGRREGRQNNKPDNNEPISTLLLCGVPEAGLGAAQEDVCCGRPDLSSCGRENPWPVPVQVIPGGPFDLQ
jgi:hypothetical protein